MSVAPNPFNPETVIRYALAADSRISLVVYDVTGRRIRALASGFFVAGIHEARWDGQDDAGRPVASGVYVVRFVADDRATVARVTLVR